jgi:hypothetical protein
MSVIDALVIEEGCAMRATIYLDGGRNSAGGMNFTDGQHPPVHLALPARLIELIILYLEARQEDCDKPAAAQGWRENDVIARKDCIEVQSVNAYRSLIHRLIREAAKRAGVPAPPRMFASRTGGGKRLEWDVQVA